MVGGHLARRLPIRPLRVWSGLVGFAAALPLTLDSPCAHTRRGAEIRVRFGLSVELRGRRHRGGTPPREIFESESKAFKDDRLLAVQTQTPDPVTRVCVSAGGAGGGTPLQLGRARSPAGRPARDLPTPSRYRFVSDLPA